MKLHGVDVTDSCSFYIYTKELSYIALRFLRHALLIVSSGWTF